MFKTKKLKLLDQMLAMPEIRRVWEAGQKQKQLGAMVNGGLNYAIVQDLINSAAHGVVVELRFPDGSSAVMRREDMPVTTGFDPYFIGADKDRV